LKRSKETQNKIFEYISTQHGGYHRYDFIDHAYLYNLYFPPERFFDLLKTQIHELVLNYPVAQDAVADWVGVLINQPKERIVVGNGTTELIKIISANIAKRLIIPVPSFNEYANAAAAGTVSEFPLELPSFTLNVDKFADQALACGADVAVVVNPNNPTSLLAPKADLIRLTKRLASHGCLLIVDESFIDFANNSAQVSLEQDIALYPNLVILKSMSKAYGICGLRLGYMLTANASFAETIRGHVPIWNINGFAETFLQMAPQYQTEFELSCTQVRADRDIFYLDLCTISDLLVYQPEANYIFCRLPDYAPSGPKVVRQLFIDHNIYIKDCAGKNMPEADRYLRIASRSHDENKQLTSALREVLEKN